MEQKTQFDIVRLTLEEDSGTQWPYRTIEVIGANALGTLQDEIDEYGWKDMIEAIDWGDGAFFRWYEWYDNGEKDDNGRVRVHALIRVIPVEQDADYKSVSRLGLLFVIQTDAPAGQDLRYEFVKLVDLQAVLAGAAEAAT